MRLGNPLGLLALLCIPVIIFIYIIKNRYTEQTITSTYIWRLSEKFLKKRLPINRFVGIISLVLQILLVTVASFAVAQPSFTLKNSAQDYLFVLDASASMNMSQGGKTRFETAKEEIEGLIKSSAKGSSYSLILADGSGSEVFSEVTDKDRAQSLVKDTDATFLSDDLSEALLAAQMQFENKPSYRIYLATDKEVDNTDNVTVLNVRKNASNFAVTALDYTFVTDGVKVTGEVVSYSGNDTLNLSLYIDGAESGQKQVQAVKGVKSEFTFTSSNKNFAKLAVRVGNKDALAEDNEIILYNVSYDNTYKVLLVSNDPFFLRSALNTAAGADVTTVSTAKYASESDVYDLYVFDSFTPASLPQSGAVWFFNPGVTTAGAGFSVQECVEMSTDTVLNYSASSHSTVISLQKGLLKETISVKKYQRIKLHRNFSVVATLQSNPAVFAGTNDNGNREVVFAFDVHDSDFPVSYDYVVIMHNFLNYIFPTEVEGNFYHAGDVLQVNMHANCMSVRVDAPSGEAFYLDTNTEIAEYDLNEVGTYTITVNTRTGQKEYSIFVAVPEEECDVEVQKSVFLVEGTRSQEKRDGIFDDLWYLFIAAAVLALADWGVYCYEQFKLR